jgi:phage terminase large subunit-like protein
MSKNYLLEYREAIAKGEFIVGIELLTALDMYISDLDNPDYKYDTQKAHSMIDFMENCIRLTKSPFYNKPMKLMLWQKAWIECLYSFKIFDKDLNKWVDRFTETLLLIARKNTKSETSSALCDTELLIGGEGMDIVCASNTYDQSDILYEACDLMRQLVDPNNQDTWRNRKGLTCLYNNNKITKMSERTKGKEGKNIDIAVVDEVHEMIDDSLIKPIEQSMSIKDNKKLILITTEGFTNDGYLDNKLKECRAVLSGEDTSFKSKRMLIWLYTQDSEQEVWNVNEDGVNPAWQKSNPTLVYGIKKWSYLRDQVDGARKSKSDRMFVLSKDFNFKVSNGQAWLLKEDYDYELDFNIEDFKDTMCLGAVDLAETTDLANAKVMLIRKEDRRKYILSHYWIPESKLQESDDKAAGAKYMEWAEARLLTICEGNDVDLSLIGDWFYDLQKKYNIRLFKCGYDQRFKQDWVKRMEYYGWTDKEDLIMINQSPDVLHLPNKQVEADLKDKLIVGLNEIDKWCLGNAALKVNNLGKSLIVKIDGQKSKRIDGAVTLVILQETYNRYKSDLLDYLK